MVERRASVPIKFKCADPTLKFPENLAVLPEIGHHVLARREGVGAGKADGVEMRVTRITHTALVIYLTVVNDDQI